MTRPWVSDLVQRLQDAKKELILKRDPSVVPFPPGMIFMNRLQFGFYSVLARLDAVANCREVERDFLETGGEAAPSP